MKNLTQRVMYVVALAALFLTSKTFAQSSTAGDSRDTRLGIGLNLGIPTSDGYSFVIGGDLRLQKDFFSNVSGVLSAGYESFLIKDEFGGGNSGFISVKAGIKVFPIERLYISGELGGRFQHR